MKREDMIEQMINFVESTPKESSDYHKMDMLLSRMERLGVLPPLRKSTPEDLTNTGMDQEFLDEHDFQTNKWDRDE